MSASAVPHFEDVELGDELPTLHRTVTRDQVIAYCRVRSPEAPVWERFADDEYARAEGLPGAIVPGNMSLGLLAQLVTDWAGAEALRHVDVVFRGVIPHNVPLRLGGVVTDKELRDGEPIVECDLYAEDAHGERPVTGKAVLVLRRRG